MKLKNTVAKTIFLFIFSLFFSQNSFSQCFEIESILVDACEGAPNTEGLNEMVRFKVGATAINTSNMTVNWPSNSWGGVIQNTITASKVAALNTAILVAGGCGQVLEPTAGVLPANATVVLVTSYNFDTNANSFGALTDTIYILFQNKNVTAGHFGNFGTSATRTLKINFGTCSDTVTYNRSLLIDQSGQNAAGDGATVLFTPSGAATYINNGCVAPISIFTVNANPASVTTCAGNPVSLTGTAQGQQSVIWSASSGTFSNPNALSTTFTPAIASAGTTVIVTLTATNSCGAQIFDTVNVIVSDGVTPNFDVTPINICTGSSVPTLSATSPNGITGTWSPSAISNTASGIYTFTPNSGQCATSVSLSVTVGNSTIPNFEVTPLNICSGSSVPTLNTTSPNGITGIWSPSAISNTNSGTYTFTPNAGQCATSVSLNVTVGNSTVPNFNVTPINICAGSSVPTLSTTSPNGITGTWSPSSISNTNSGTYTFTPNSGQCATSVSLNVNVGTLTITPISGADEVCQNNSIQLTNSTSSGTWSSSNNVIATVDNNGNVTGIAPGTITIKYTVSNGSCTVYDEKVITVNPLPNPRLSNKTICVDQNGATISNAILNSQIPDNGNFSFVWTLNNNVLPNSTNQHEATEIGLYKVVVTNLATGCTASAISLVSANSNATATASIEQDFGDIQTITVNVTGGSGNFEYQLDNGPIQTNNQFTGPFLGEYQIRVKDLNGCTEIFLDVFALNYPKYFTPNGDSYHDYWNIKSLADQPDAQIYIFDRYGKLLKNLSPVSKGWDGTYNGRQLPSTDYWFKVIYRGRNGNQKEFKAHFSMKR
ncbi:T9SS type B sorting domain-containing protein [Flavobacterium qiangtangense]|uniref:T9SS type B sorting domain-containing protein n=1 Tax=Flavobacterium qiangtangense TaxID=1442595 RepID=A0ABW1PI73_9FLAO